MSSRADHHMPVEVRAPITAARWLEEGRRVVAATLVDVEGSAPFQLGATMLVDDGGHIEGSVTGGCVEGALVEMAGAAFNGAGPRTETFGIPDADAVSVGLMCGGTVRVFVHELEDRARAAVAAVARKLEAGEPAAVATLLDGRSSGATLALVGDEVVGSLGVSPRLDGAVEKDARGALAHGRPGVRRYGVDGQIMGDELRVYIHPFVEPARLIIFGAIDFSAAVAASAKLLGYRVTICDARRTFLSSSRFALADEVVAVWPDEYLERQALGPRDAILVFTHDPKFDEPALRAALASPAGYIGALGSRKTHAERVERLVASGISRESLERISAPCGLDIGARTPEETAVSIVAELISRSSGRTGEPLAGSEGPIHPELEPTHAS